MPAAAVGQRGRPSDSPRQDASFSLEQLERHARELADINHSKPVRLPPRSLLPRLDDSSRRIDETYRTLTTAPTGQGDVLSEQTLLDNFHVVRDQVSQLHQQLPRRDYRQLPQLAEGPLAGYPRVYQISRELIAHTAGRLEGEVLAQFVDAYQSIAPLALSELRAFAIMLRLGLLEELGRVGEDVAAAWRSRERVRHMGALLDVRGRETGRTIDETMQDEMCGNARLSSAFVVELLNWLRTQPPSGPAAWDALTRALEAQGDSPEYMLRTEHQREAAVQLAMLNIITSMRLLSSLDWPLFIERTSRVDRVLREDPSGAYAHMDLSTRDLYRQSVEALARRSRTSELQVADAAIEQARQAHATHPGDDRRHHVGYYLISSGRLALQAHLGRPTLRERVAQSDPHRAALAYYGAIGLVSAVAMTYLLLHAHRHGSSPTHLLLLALVVLIPASELVIFAVNLLVTWLIERPPLPKLETAHGISSHHRAIVVVPALLTSEKRVGELLEQLELHFLGNRDDHLHFALVGDFADAPAKAEPDDQLAAIATRAITELNERYGPDRFFFFRREHRRNAVGSRWSRRGHTRDVLVELTHLLRDAPDTTLAVIVGNPLLLPSVKYVIRLDSRTQLPTNAGRQLVGTLAHPLNRPTFDPRRHRVTAGHGIVQPRVRRSATTSNSTWFARLFPHALGLSLYRMDAHLPPFAEHDYTGIGIYDVDTFRGLLSGPGPMDPLRNHDLIDGFRARAAFCAEIDVIGDVPTAYMEFATRQARQTRRYWQLVRWLWHTIPDASGRATSNTLPASLRLRLLDKLRQSLLPPSVILLMAAAWLVPTDSAVLWTISMLVLVSPVFEELGQSLSIRGPDPPAHQRLRAERDNLARGAVRAVVGASLVGHQSLVSLAAIVRSRVPFAKADPSSEGPDGPGEIDSDPHMQSWTLIRRMGVGPALALAVTAVVLVSGPPGAKQVLPVAVLWLISPALAYVSGAPRNRRQAPLTADERRELRRTARQTWRFFEELVGPDGHGLAPDSFSESRRDDVTLRTSPTNIGLQLLSALAAYDFGYLDALAVVDHVETTFETMLSLSRYRGHLFNWYDIRTLAPTNPAFISTVESGNLAGYLLTLKQGLREIAETAPVVGERFVEGVTDSVALLEEHVTRLARGRRVGHPIARRVTREIAALRDCLKTPTFAAWPAALEEISVRLRSIGVLLEEAGDLPRPSEEEAQGETTNIAEATFWLDRALATVSAQRAHLEMLAPWVALAMQPNSPVDLPSAVPSLRELVIWCDHTLSTLSEESHRNLCAALRRSRQEALTVIDRVERLSTTADRFVEDMEFSFLFNHERQLFSTGFSVSDGLFSSSYCDTLASEARLASFIAIATGTTPQEHWFKLGRSHVVSGQWRALLTWNASMCEYLAPLLIMRTYHGSLLDDTCHAVVQRQIDYAASRKVPWGISDCAYNAPDEAHGYQYRSFGVPGLGLRRGLADDLVVAPYASILAASIRPHDTARNLRHLAAEGVEGRFGYYDAKDYTPTRQPAAETNGVVVRTFVAQHQAMTLVALDNCLHEGPMQVRFHSDLRVRQAEPLLQERLSRTFPLRRVAIEVAENRPAVGVVPQGTRRYTTTSTAVPVDHLLSNGSYSVLITNVGGGYSVCRNVVLTRPDRSPEGDSGSFCFIRDSDTGAVWSAMFEPTHREPDDYEVTFAADRAVFRRVDDKIETRNEVAVSPEDDVEVRRLSLTNHTQTVRTLEVTTYSEVVLLTAEELSDWTSAGRFLETYFAPERHALTCVRRFPSHDTWRHLVQVVAGSGRLAEPVEFETDRERFVGRGRTVRSPSAMAGANGLSKTTGLALNPIMSLRQRLRLPPGGTARISFATGFAESEDVAQGIVQKYQDGRNVARALALAATHSQIELRHLGRSSEDYQRLVGLLRHGRPRGRSQDTAALAEHLRFDLSRYGVSGELPAALLFVGGTNELAFVDEVLNAHLFCRLRQFHFDLVVVNEAAPHGQQLQEELDKHLEMSLSHAWLERRGGISLRRADLIPETDRISLGSVARATFRASDGSLRDQLNLQWRPFEWALPPERDDTVRLGEGRPAERRESTLASRYDRRTADAGSAAFGDGLAFFNGLGGFTPDGRAYVVRLDASSNECPPSPWRNVIANEHFGFVATESTPGYTWSGNSHDNLLTPWQNDPSLDPVGELIFIRDEDTGEFWSATPLPAPGSGDYIVRHGHGYSAYGHTTSGVSSELLVFVPLKNPVKILRLRLTNLSDRARRCSATLYVEWVLGNESRRSYVRSSVDEKSGALFARNTAREAFASRVAYVDVNRPHRTVATERAEFLGRKGTPANPAGLSHVDLLSFSSENLEPCGVLQVKIDAEPGETAELIFQIGDATGETQARALLFQYRHPERVAEAFQMVQDFWDDLLGTVAVRTPDPAMDVMLNRWALYQVLAGRMWSSTGFSDSGGARRFSEYAQSAIALVFAAPALARAHILCAAARQFREGDVQHWWREPGGHGLRRRISDDALWLVFATVEYVKATGDVHILDERIPFLEGRTLSRDEDETYDRPAVSSEHAALYEHCARAIARSMDVGQHGLPLVSIGDFTRGIDRAGRGGKGESVWLGWFLYAQLVPFAQLADSRRDRDRAREYREYAARLKDALERSWDGHWYRSAYFDDGAALGSSLNEECKIDSVAQSWAVISGAADSERAAMAMEAVDKWLVQRDNQLIQVLSPPFDRMRPSAGSVGALAPGVRENGGQDTEAAFWAVLAFARLGDGDRAADLFALLNPVNHTRTADAVGRYCTEPYVVADYIHAAAPHIGRGDGTWRTGAAGWLYRVGIEAILGITMKDGALRIDPCIPRSWPRYEVSLRYAGGHFAITVENPHQVNRGVIQVVCDGVVVENGEIPIMRGDAVHQVRVVLGPLEDSESIVVDTGAENPER